MLRFIIWIHWKEKDTLNIFVNGVLREEEGEFTDEGTETKWEEDGNSFILSARNSGNKHDGILYKLTIGGAEIPESCLITWRKLYQIFKKNSC